MPQTDSHAPGSFCWFELGTTDQDRAKAFYSNLFGWTASDLPLGPDEAYTMFRLEGRDVAAAHSLRRTDRDAGVPSHWIPYVAVVSADETAVKITAAGGELVAPPFDVMTAGRMAVAKDPTGAYVSIWEAKSHIGSSITGEPGTACWVDLVTRDLERAKLFYGSVFDWTFDGSEYVHIRNMEQYIGGMQRPHAAHVPPHWLVYFEVPDTDRDASKAESLGAKIRVAPMNIETGGRFSVMFDPQGAIFALWRG